MRFDKPSDFAKLMSDRPDLQKLNPGVTEVTTTGPGKSHTIDHLVNATSEHDAQVAVFAWIDANVTRWPDLAAFFAVPNGGYRHPATAGRMRSEGQRAGVPDILGIVPMRHLDTHYAGIAIEVKVGRNKPTPTQLEWLERLRKNGFLAVVCYGAEDTIAAIKHYLYILED